jgi:hypothetical protein
MGAELSACRACCGDDVPAGRAAGGASAVAGDGVVELDGRMRMESGGVVCGAGRVAALHSAPLRSEMQSISTPAPTAALEPEPELEPASALEPAPNSPAPPSGCASSEAASEDFGSARGESPAHSPARPANVLERVRAFLADASAGLDEGLLSLCLPHSRFYAESL